MRRAFAILVLFLGLSLQGCSLFKKNNTNTGGGDNSLAPPAPAPKFPTAPGGSGDPLNGQSRGPNDPSATPGLLAGYVRDGAGRPPLNTSILVVNAEAKDDSSGRELSVNPDGSFTIQNLERGGQYKLVARGKQGDRAVAGIHYATATNTRIMIQVKEDLVSSTTPAVQGPFGSLKDDKKFTPLAPVKEAQAKENWQPALGVDGSSGEVVLPAMQVAANPDGFKQNASGWVTPPPLAIKAKEPNFARITPVETPARDVPASLGAATVPSCVLVGQQVVNFALNDINGKPWELKANRTGKLVLLDFWGTWCAPCRQGMPALKGLQNKYGSQGLEVIGIAYEQGGTPDEQAYKVNDVCQKLLVNYRQLLGSGSSCPVKSQLRVHAYPTMVLLDEQGYVLWRHAGLPTRTEMEELERLVQSRTRNVAAN